MRTPAGWLRAATMTAAAGLLVPALLVAAAPAGSAAGSGSSVLRPRPLSTSVELPNPLRGQYTWMGQQVQPTGWPAADRYDRDVTYWGMLEPTKGAYDFRRIDAGLAAAGAVKGKYGFRVMAYCPGCWMELRTDFPSVTPSFVPRQPGTAVPDWNSEAFLSRWELLWSALGAKYKDDPRLGYVDVGGFGPYGEWMPAGTDITKANAMRLIGAVAKAFPSKHVLLSAVPLWTNRPAVTGDALKAFGNLGLRSDCLGGTAMQYPGNGFEDVWKTRPFYTEWCTNGDPLVAVSQVPSYHVSTISSGNRRLTYDSMTAAQRSAYEKTLRTSGFRYQVTSATFGAITAGQTMSVALALRNQGVAPTYERWQTNLVFKDAAGRRLATVPLSLDLRGRLPGSSTYSQNVTAPALPPGSYDVAVEVVDPQNYSPKMRLANTDRDDDGSYILGAVIVGDPRQSTQRFMRLRGDDRYAASATISRATFAPGAEVAYVATGTKFPDALSGAPAAGRLGGPVLLTRPTTLPPETAAELSRLRPKRIVVLGGSDTVSDGVLAALRAYSGSVTRLAGTNRYDGSAKISAATFAPGAAVAYVATGTKFPDALAGAAPAGKLGGPVLLVRPTSLPSQIAAELTRLKPRRIVILGGTDTVSADVERSLRAYSGSVSRLAGTNRYDGAARLSAATYAPGAPVAYVATGTNFPDALSGAPAAGRLGGPVLLVTPNAVPTQTALELARLKPQRIVILGGRASMSTAVQRQLVKYAPAS
ncbi:cell wall-binding repeat-containing protein [Phycicoccus flavus]|uniref:DUF4832 domain-containing protein n=1 Tax=Phycicoccus flavus TaxID=2502783 RepID=A0A8T6R3S5_9MICO|nr:cell wall-binding repeat-containing protein [Phycicoccus flavus]NHA68273.1 DUF4832 domain-containing protein [Phycicoccus flavus]